MNKHRLKPRGSLYTHGKKAEDTIRTIETIEPYFIPTFGSQIGQKVAEMPVRRKHVPKRAYERKFPGDAWLLVHHETTDDYVKDFQERGIDATKPPPTTRYGRLTMSKENPMGLQTPIETPGLYVSPLPEGGHGVVILTQFKDLGISRETMGSRHPAKSLFSFKDGLITKKIPAKQVVGEVDYDWKDKKWGFTPNPKSLRDPKIAPIARKIRVGDSGNVFYNESPEEYYTREREELKRHKPKYPQWKDD